MAASTHLFTSKLRVQVAAVCFRRTNDGVEFLLVNTDGGRWTFPKGMIEARLSHSQAAAKEALEEAGAAGLIDRKHFHVYLHSKGEFWRKPAERKFAVKAFLLEVQRLGRPQEPLRNPTWFCPDLAKEMLAKRREPKYGNELSEVIDKAIERIHRPRRDGPQSMADATARGILTQIPCWPESS